MASFDAVSHPEACDLTRPTLFFLPGVLTTDGAALPGQSAEEALAHKSWLVERHLGGGAALAAGVRLFALTYSSAARYWTGGQWVASRVGRAGDTKKWTRAPEDYFSEDAKRLVDAMLLPALAAPLAAHDVAGVKARLANLTLFGDSYGSVFAEQMANVLQRAFRAAGFAEPELQEMLGGIHVIGACNMPPRHGDNRMTGVYFEARNDRMIHSTRAGPPPPRLSLFDKEEAHRHAQQVATASRLARLAERAENAKSLFHAFRTSAHFRDLSPEETAALVAKTQAPYLPSPVEYSDLWVERVPKGAVVTFEAPGPIDVLLPGEDGAIKGRHFPNDMRHNSFGYYYPGPGRRDHVDLLARVLCNMVRRPERFEAPDLRALLNDPAQPFGAVNETQQAAIDAQLDRVLDLSTRRERDERFANGRHRESEHLRTELVPRATPSAGWPGGR